MYNTDYLAVPAFKYLKYVTLCGFLLTRIVPLSSSSRNRSLSHVRHRYVHRRTHTATTVLLTSKLNTDTGIGNGGDVYESKLNHNWLQMRVKDLCPGHLWVVCANWRGLRMWWCTDLKYGDYRKCEMKEYTNEESNVSTTTALKGH